MIDDPVDCIRDVLERAIHVGRQHPYDSVTEPLQPDVLISVAPVGSRVAKVMISVDLQGHAQRLPEQVHFQIAAAERRGNRTVEPK